MSEPSKARPWPITHKDLAYRLGEAIRRVLAGEHLPNCSCSKNLRNECRERILNEAFKLYCEQCPERFP